MRDPRDIDIKFIKGIGPQRAELLKKELGITNGHDLLYNLPSNYIDRSRNTHLADLTGEEMRNIQLCGRFVSFTVHGEGSKARMLGLFTDGTGTIEVVWFRKIKDIQRFYDTQKEYVLFGNAYRFNNRWSIAHPEIETREKSAESSAYRNVYPLTERLRKAGITSKHFMTWTRTLLSQIKVPEVLPITIIESRSFPSRHEALVAIHNAADPRSAERARERMKYEELFFLQLNILRYSKQRNKSLKGHRFPRIGNFFNLFYHNYLPFDLTDAQKRVLREIRENVNSGKQMNRLLQGDVGSGKTIVALLAMLMAIDNGFQACLMAPTEILATQHFETLKTLASQCGVSIELLTGSTPRKERDVLHSRLRCGELKILVGTHALLEDEVQFHNLGLAIIDEQHRFGVVQRSRLWRKNTGIPPHVLVMTATPIPRTLAMTVYGDLDVSIIDQLPPGRKPVTTLMRFEEQRRQVYRALGYQLSKGRQAYIVFPLIEENEKLDLKSLQEGYETIKEHFPSYKVAMVHGKMKPTEKDWNMHLFATGEAQILVATTVIEVGVNVPNATTMIIENAERFGLSQLHQLRGRVGRGGDQSYCILMSKMKMSRETRQRLEIMTSTTDGFVVAEADLKLRGPGDIEGTMQSGIAFDLRIASLATDGQIMELARADANEILDADGDLSGSENRNLLRELLLRNPKEIDFSRIS